MKLSSLFYGTQRRIVIEQKIRALLDSQKGWITKDIKDSPRAIGDAVQARLGDCFSDIVSSLNLVSYNASFSRRAMADLAFEDRDGFYYIVDIKTHRRNAKFSMPNLVSVERLSRFYEEDKNYFVILMISYEVHDSDLAIDEINFVPIEFLDWECLSIGALGWGQIQIANANQISLVAKPSRRSWMIRMCDELLEFYPNEITKIGERVSYFRSLREKWKDRKP